MLKKMLCIGMIVFFFAFMSVDTNAQAATGKINCWLQWGEHPVKDGSLEICRIGDPVQEGYQLLPEFGGGIIAGEEIPSEAFALWIAQKAGWGTEREPDRNGLVCFDGLEPGIYLIRQGSESESYLPIAPYLACVSVELSVIDTFPVVVPMSPIPRTGQYKELYYGTLGISITLTGIFYILLTKQEKKKPI